MENNPAADEEHFLDPLMEVLSKYRSLEDLIASVSMIFHRLDLDGSDGLGFDELKEVCNPNAACCGSADLSCHRHSDPCLSVPPDANQHPVTNQVLFKLVGATEAASDEYHSRGLVRGCGGMLAARDGFRRSRDRPHHLSEMDTISIQGISAPLVEQGTHWRSDMWMNAY